MPKKNKRNGKNFEIGVASPNLGKHASPYVLDLNKCLAEKAEAKKVEVKPAAPKVEKTRVVRQPIFSRLTFIRFSFRLRRNVKKFLFFLFRGPKKVFKNFVYVIQVIPRLFKFLKFALEDYKRILSFGFIAFVFILPLQTFSYYESLKKVKGEAESEARAAYESILAGREFAVDADFSAAAENFGQAAVSFSQAQEEVGRINSVVTNLIKNIPVGGEKIEAGEALLFSGERISSAGSNILSALADFTAENNDKSLTLKLKNLRDSLAAALPEVAIAADRLSVVRSQAVPEDEREVFIKLQEGLPSLVISLKKIIFISDLMVKFLGDESEKRYLVVFQNPGELRPTGGFIGSLALLDIDRGKITNMEIPGGGPYDFQGSLKEKISAPEPLRLINARFELQDANWFPDFPTSAEKIKWFYEHGGGPTVDGVIAVNADLVAELLGIFGPIDMPEYGKTLSQENFIEELQKAVEVEYDKKENKPKKIIADMAPRLVEKILASDSKQFGKILAVLVKALGEKNILLYSVYPEVLHEFEKLGWAGEIKNVSGDSDYLMTVHTNIGGGKTDRVISEEDRLEVKISEDGSIINKLTIKRMHAGVKGEPFTGVRNVDYLRVYVPTGSKLISASGFEAPPAELFEKPGQDYWADSDLKNSEGNALLDEGSGTRITNESGKTVFGNWIQVDPGEEVIVSVEYLLPFKLSLVEETEGWWAGLWGENGKEKNVAPYQLLVQKQSGSKNNLVGQVDFPGDWGITSLYGQGTRAEMSRVIMEASLDSDKFYSFGFFID
jgi:hypothetical protein